MEIRDAIREVECLSLGQSLSSGIGILVTHPCSALPGKLEQEPVAVLLGCLLLELPLTVL